MTPKLMDRLARLEEAQATQGAAGAVPTELLQGWLRAVAVALGGYPRPAQPGAAYGTDHLGDGFARGLGYADRDDLEAQSAADPEDWRQRIARAQIALRERYRSEAGADLQADDDATLLHAVAFYGAKAGVDGSQP